MSPLHNDIEELMNPLVTLIPLKYLDALLLLNSKLKDEHIQWAISGDLGEALRTVHVDPDCIEIVTNKEGAKKIFQSLREYNPQKLKRRTETLSRPAVIGEKEYRVRVRSHFFKFNMNSIIVKVYGDLQFQIADWEWGDKLEFEPDYIYVVGQKMAVVPLQLKYNLHLGLGWIDRAEEVLKVLSRKYKRRLNESLSRRPNRTFSDSLKRDSAN
jgi:hypothetical protein